MTERQGFAEMADNSEWTRKGATLSDVTAQTEYGVTREFIIKGIKGAQLEFREGSNFGNPYLKILRCQLEKFIVDQFGADYLTTKKSEAELNMITKKIRSTKKELAALEARKLDLERALNKRKS